jgi:uncharacterized PurR-regulated membrane protein YhhQ (DUF165 family)
MPRLRRGARDKWRIIKKTRVVSWEKLRRKLEIRRHKNKENENEPEGTRIFIIGCAMGYYVCDGIVFCRVATWGMFLMIALYLSAIVLANLSVAFFGPQFTVLNAFLFIGLDLTSRDVLHERWHNKGLVWKMALLIASGSILSYILNKDAGPIALASFVAFCAAGLVDTITYQILKDKTRMIKINGSNVTSALVDSVVFPALAFGFPLMFGIMAGQFIAKVVGGFVWSLALRKWRQ